MLYGTAVPKDKERQMAEQVQRPVSVNKAILNFTAKLKPSKK